MPKEANKKFDLPKLFTIDQVATYTHFSTRQIRRWIESGMLKGFKFGRHWRIAENDVAQFMATLPRR